jgi:hypothetical protein
MKKKNTYNFSQRLYSVNKMSILEYVLQFCQHKPWNGEIKSYIQMELLTLICLTQDEIVRSNLVNFYNLTFCNSLVLFVKHS